MRTEIIVIGAGASGLMAAYGAAKTLSDAGHPVEVTLLEKMPRPARKVMITGKGRCNFTNVKPWNEFSEHIRSKQNFLRPAYQNLTPAALSSFLNEAGLETVIERGDRAYPASHRASDVVDALVRMASGVGVKILTDSEVISVSRSAASSDSSASSGSASASDSAGTSRSASASASSRSASSSDSFTIECADGQKHFCRRLIIATGGLSYPGTGSTGDGYAWAEGFGHSLAPLFPSLTALVPRGYKSEPYISRSKGHIDRSTPLSALGQALCGVQLKNVALTSIIENCEAESEFGDLDFTDGGIEGPLGFRLSRKCVKSLINGSRVKLRLDLKHGVPPDELRARVSQLWREIKDDPRSRGVGERELCRILLGKLMPRELIPGFLASFPDIISVERKAGVKDRFGKYSVGKARIFIHLQQIADALKRWDFEIAGFVGYERAVVTSGGVRTDELTAKTLESRIVPGLYFCGELVDIDADTGGYNLHCAFSTGLLAGQSAAKSLL